MENIVCKTFDSPLSLDQMLAALTAKIEGVDWGIRESDYDDRYLKGTTKEAVKRRVLTGESPGKFSIEVYFPLTPEAEPALSHADKRAFMKRVDGHVLAALKAENIEDEV
ncbi:MAG: hypothetical protein R3B70_02105 [Polyangiaceae bacterium]